MVWSTNYCYFETQKSPSIVSLWGQVRAYSRNSLGSPLHLKGRFKKHLSLKFPLILLCNCHCLKLCLWHFLLLSETDAFLSKVKYTRDIGFTNQKLADQIWVVKWERKDTMLYLRQKVRKWWNKIRVISLL